jgi:hypothetical protein
MDFLPVIMTGSVGKTSSLPTTRSRPDTFLTSGDACGIKIGANQSCGQFYPQPKSAFKPIFRNPASFRRPPALPLRPCGILSRPRAEMTSGIPGLSHRPAVPVIPRGPSA